MKILGRGKVVVFLLFMTTTVTGFLFSQSDEGKVVSENVMNLTVDQAVDYANQNSKTLKSSAIDLEMKRRANGVKWNQLLPAVNVTGTVSRSNKKVDTSAAMMEGIAGMLGRPAPAPAEITESDHWRVVGNVGDSKYQVKQLWEMSLPEKERRVQCCDTVSGWVLWADRECHEVRLWLGVMG